MTWLVGSKRRRIFYRNSHNKMIPGGNAFYDLRDLQIIRQYFPKFMPKLLTKNELNDNINIIYKQRRMRKCYVKNAERS